MTEQKTQTTGEKPTKKIEEANISLSQYPSHFAKNGREIEIFNLSKYTAKYNRFQTIKMNRIELKRLWKLLKRVKLD